MMIECKDHLGRTYRSMQSLCKANGIEYAPFYRLIYNDVSVTDAIRQLTGKEKKGSNRSKKPKALKESTLPISVEHKKHLVDDLDRKRKAAGRGKYTKMAQLIDSI